MDVCRSGILINYHTQGSVFIAVCYFLWPPCVADADIIFLPCGFYLLSFFPCLISAVTDWMSTILRHMMWP